MTTRTTSECRTITVRHVAKPSGQERRNGPSLADLREFVEATKDLPDETFVRISLGNLSESGRRDVEIVAIHRANLAEDQADH